MYKTNKVTEGKRHNYELQPMIKRGKTLDNGVKGEPGSESCSRDSLCVVAKQIPMLNTPTLLISM